MILPIRVSGKKNKENAKSILFDCLHFENMLKILIREFYDKYQKSLVNLSILAGLFSKKYKGKYQEEFQKIKSLIEQDEKLKDLYEKLKEQKDKIKNSALLSSVIRKVVRDFTNYFKALESYKNNPDKFKGIPRPPKPKKLKWVSNYSVEFVTALGIVKREKDYILLELKAGKDKKFLNVKIPKWFNYPISSARLKMIGEDIWVDLVYECPSDKIEPKGDWKVGIDLGLDELISAFSENPIIRSFIISGREIKSFNQWYNKVKAKIQSDIDNLRNELSRETSEMKKKILEEKIKWKLIELKRLTSYRKRYLDTLFHQISKKLVAFLYETGHKVIYIGKNCIESKNGINLGEKINQAFVSVPFRKLVDYIKYKAERLGMEVVEVDESYTSKTSPFADIFKVGETKDFQGNREGNLFKDFITSKVFHSDLVGALNIMRKGAKLLKLDIYNNLKVLFKKLCNPKRFKLWEWIYRKEKVFPELLMLGVGGRERRWSSAGVLLQI